MADDDLQELRQKRLQELAHSHTHASGDDHGHGDSPVAHLDDSDFAQFLGSNAVALVDFWAPWCGPCHMLAPTIEGLARRWQGRVAVGKLNTDEAPKTAQAFNVMSIPTVYVFKDGKPVKRLVGVHPAGNYNQVLAEVTGGDAPPSRSTRL